LNVAFGNPGLLRAVGLGRLLKSLGAERQYKNDEQIDNALRSVIRLNTGLSVRPNPFKVAAQ
jgi:hypothetical protein